MQHKISWEPQEPISGGIAVLHLKKAVTIIGVYIQLRPRMEEEPDPVKDIQSDYYYLLLLFSTVCEETLESAVVTINYLLGSLCLSDWLALV